MTDITFSSLKVNDETITNPDSIVKTSILKANIGYPIRVSLLIEKAL